MKKKLKRVVREIESKYILRGFVGWIVLRHHDPDQYCGADLNEEFQAANDGEAILLARAKAQNFLLDNPQYSPIGHVPKEGEWDRTFWFELTKTMWKGRYEGPSTGKAAVPAVPARPACIMEFREKQTADNKKGRKNNRIRP